MNSATDISVLSPPVILGSSDVLQILNSFKDGTEEVRNALMYECKVILECKVCSSLFRGLPNFLAHKRKYCQECISKHKQLMESKLTNFEVLFAEVPADNSEREPVKPSEFYAGVKTRLDERQLLKREARVQLLRIDENMNAVYQNIANVEHTKDVSKLGPSRVTTSFTDKTDTDPETPEHKQDVFSEADLEDVKKDAQKEDSSQAKINSKHMHQMYRKMFSHYHFCDLKHLVCKKCNINYQSFKSLKRHMLAKHISGTKHYTCTKCGMSFTKAYSMKRHLLQMHEMSWGEIERSYEMHQGSFRLRTIGPLQLKQSKDSSKVKDEKAPDGNATKAEHLASECNVTEKENCHNASSSPLNSKLKERKQLTLFRCSHCNKAFGKKLTYDSHLENCSKANYSQNPSHNLGLDRSSEKDSSMKGILNGTGLVKKETTDTLNDEDRDKNGTEIPAAKGRTGSMEKFKQNLYKMRFSSHQSLSEEYAKQLKKITDESKHKCLKCGMKFSSNSALHLHAARHMGWKRFKCKLCGYKGFNRSDIKTHLKRSHTARVVGLDDLNKYIIGLANQSNDGGLTIDVSNSPDVATTVRTVKDSSANQTSGRSSSKQSPSSRAAPPSSSSSSKRSSPNAASSVSSSSSASTGSSCSAVVTNYNISTRRNQRVFDLRPCRALKYCTGSQDKK